MNCRITFLGSCALVLASWLCGSARAELRFEKPNTDLGKIRGGPYLTYVLYFANVGQQPIQIVETRASCTCMQPLIAPQNLQPGERGAMQITVNTLSLTPGAHTWHVRVAYRDGAAPAEAAVNLTAHYTPEVSVTPAIVTFYTDKSLTHEIVLTDIRAKTLKITGVESSSPYLEASVTKQQRNLRGHWVGAIALKTRSDMPPGRHEETLAIYTDDPQYRQLQVSVGVVKKGANHISAHPNRVTLNVSQGQPIASQLLRVHNTGAEAISIRRISADVPGFNSRWAPGPGADATVRVLADGARIRSETQGTIQIEIDSPTHETLTVPLTVVVE